MSFLLKAAEHGAADLMVLTLVLGAQAFVGLAMWRQADARRRRWILAGAAASLALLGAGFLLQFIRVARYLSPSAGAWIRGAAMIWALLSVPWAAAWMIRRAMALKLSHSPARRGFLTAAGSVLFAAPAAAVGYGVFIERDSLRLREQNIVIPGLAPDLDGIRIAQLTDIHLSAFVSEKLLARAVAVANETYPHIALVTGDMISAARDPLDACLRHLAGLRAEAGIFGCLGNHEVYARAENYATRAGARLGIHYLRSQAVRLKFGGGELNLAGVDYQKMHSDYLEGAERMIQPGLLNILLSHNPDVFPVAVRQGWDFTIAGHTHGGQVRVEILRQDLNIARFFTPYVDGLYRDGARSIFVSRGIGTIGLPARLGAPPEVALLRLCRS